MRYVLKNQGYPFKFIYCARRKVGRVYRHADGHYVGMIGYTERKGATEREAFDAVVSADLGYAGVEELNAHNRSVRAANTQRRNEVRAIADRVLRGDYDALDQLLFGRTK